MSTHTSASVITVFHFEAGPWRGASAGPPLYIVCTSETGRANSLGFSSNTMSTKKKKQVQRYRVV